MRFIRSALVASALAALALATPAAAQSPNQSPDQAAGASNLYVVDVSIMRAGAEIVSGRTTLREGGQAEITLTGADGQYLFTADLQPEQGDGDDGRMLLDAYLNHDGADMANPRLIVKRGGRALMQMGSKSGDSAQLHDGVEIALTPLH